MPQVRPLILGAALLALAAPGHPLALLPGLPLGLLGIVLAALVVGWWIALPGQPPRAGLLLGAIVLLVVLKIAIVVAAPRYGLIGTYRAEAPDATSPSTPTVAASREPDAIRPALALDLRGDAFPVDFFNDIRRFNYYTANDPKRDLLPFSAVWTGQLVVPTSGRYQITLEANGPATLDLGPNGRATIEQSGRVRESSLAVDLPAGVVPITVSYVRPPELMPWLVARVGMEGSPSVVLAAPQLVQPGVSSEAIARDGWLRPVAIAVDLALIGLLAGGFVAHVVNLVRVRRTSRAKASTAMCSSTSSPTAPRPPWGSREAEGPLDRRSPLTPRPSPVAERALLALYLVAGVGAALLEHVHLLDRAVILSGGNDWLAYEGFARDILFNGPLLTEGKALGQGVPYYYQPLYIYWVALTHLVLGQSLFAPLFMNTVLGIVAGVLLYLQTRDLFGRGAALAALVIFEAYRQTVFAPTAGLLLSENLLIPLVPLFLYLLARAARSGTLLSVVLAGFALGLAGLTRTTPLALLPPALLILAFAWRRARLSWGGIGTRLAVLVLACFLTISPATIRNYVVSGRPVLITSSAGANLWEAHRPTSKVDLSRIDRDPLYERLGLDRQTREVVEFARQDPAGYAATLAPMFLYAVGVVGAIAGNWQIHPGLVGMCVAYLLVTIFSRRARSVPTWFLHAFVWSHLAQMTVFFSHQYGFRLILPMYIAMMPIAGLGVAIVLSWIATRLSHVKLRPSSKSKPATPSPPLPLAGEGAGGDEVGLQGSPWGPAGRLPLVAVTLLAPLLLLGRSLLTRPGQDAAHETFYGLNGDAALATRQAARPDLMRSADVTYFVGDDSRSTDVAYLRGLAYPTPRWFDGARGLVLPAPGEQALYVLPDRAAADVAKRCLGDEARQERVTDAATGLGLDLRIVSDAGGDCADPRLAIGAPFADAGRVLGLDAPATIEPGKTMDVLIDWQVQARPANRTRPFVRLVDSRGRRWGQAETAVYPSSSWHPGERAIGLARLDVDQTLPPGEYRLDAGFNAGQAQARLAQDGTWGAAGQTQARGEPVRLVSRSTPLATRSLPIKIPLDASFDGVRLLGATLDPGGGQAGQRVRLTLFWQNAGGRLADRDVSIIMRDGSGAILQEWHGAPVDGTYPTSAWKPSEVVRDTWDLILPADAGEIAVAMAAGAGTPPQYVRVAPLTVQPSDRLAALPSGVAPLAVGFDGGPQLAGVDLKQSRVRAGDPLDLTLYWRASAPISDDYRVAITLSDEAGRPIAQQDSEPAGGDRPTTGWAPGEVIQDVWRLRLPRDLPRGKLHISVGLVGVASNLPIPAATGASQIVLPIEVSVE